MGSVLGGLEPKVFYIILIILQLKKKSNLFLGCCIKCVDVIYGHLVSEKLNP